MGAIVFATDVRMASKEQVESLGGKFLIVEGSENLETEGGYAKEASDDYKKKQSHFIIIFLGTGIIIGYMKKVCVNYVNIIKQHII
mgnify:CR=1 FL=1